jgi:hypothetical protein
MTVRRHDETIVLDGDCGVEDAETLLQMLLASPAAPVDLSQCGILHTAVVQVLLRARPKLVGACGDRWVREWIFPQT